jgi:dihydroflavonol-4-reductase
MPKMKILLIGATGQIGFALTRALSRTSYQISILIRDKHKLTFPENIKVVEANPFTTVAFHQAIQDMDYIIYAAGLPEQFSFDTHVFNRVNYNLFKTFLQSMQQSSVRRLIYISTYEVFQPIEKLIRENNPISDQWGVTPYFKSMIQAYQLVLKFVEEANITLTTIHPAAVYGGINTSDGLNNYIENLLHRRLWRIPVIVESRFPVVHVDSLATAIVQLIDHPGAYIVSDQMTSLREVALELHNHAKSYIPPVVPLWMGYLCTTLLEFLARLIRQRPIMSRVQIEFITKGWEPKSEKTQKELRWKPLSLCEGINKYLEEWNYSLK